MTADTSEINQSCMHAAICETVPDETTWEKSRSKKREGRQPHDAYYAHLCYLGVYKSFLKASECGGNHLASAFRRRLFFWGGDQIDRAKMVCRYGGVVCSCYSSLTVLRWSQVVSTRDNDGNVAKETRRL